jgi:hypothetical protein
MGMIAYEALTVGASAVGPTEATATHRVRSAIFTVETAGVRFRADGTSPTATVGAPVEKGGDLVLNGEGSILRAEFIRRDSASATVHCMYFSMPDEAAAVRANHVPPAQAVAGASDVKSIEDGFGSTSTTRKTVLTPTSGKKVRIVSVAMYTYHATETSYAVYFGTGAAYTSDPTKAIHEARLDKAIEMNSVIVWPAGQGPVGAADDVVSVVTSDDISGSAKVTFLYTEE